MNLNAMHAYVYINPMRITKYILLFIFTFIVTNLPATNEETVAVIEFKNKAKGSISFNGNDLASQMSYQLKENDRYKPADRKAVSKIVKQSKWLDDRLSEEDEAKLKGLPAKYALYGSVLDWRSSIDSSTTGNSISPRMRTKDVIPGVIVWLNFDLVDLETGKIIKTTQAEGSAGSETKGAGEPGQSANADWARFDALFEEACKTAIRKGANTLSEEDTEQKSEDE
jgi:curli biogenesis system outer membrane secretion channel CsgG